VCFNEGMFGFSLVWGELRYCIVVSKRLVCWGVW